MTALSTHNSLSFSIPNLPPALFPFLSDHWFPEESESMAQQKKELAHTSIGGIVGHARVRPQVARITKDSNQVQLKRDLDLIFIPTSCIPFLSFLLLLARWSIRGLRELDVQHFAGEKAIV